MRPLVALPLVTLAAALAVAPPASAAKKLPKNCGLSGSTTLQATKDVRVYDYKDDTYACLNKKNKRYRLGVTDECQNNDAAQDPRIRGNFVGYVSASCGLDSGVESAVIFNVKTGKKVAAVEAAVPEVRTGNLITIVYSFEFDDTGKGVALVGFDTSAQPDHTIEVRRIDAAGTLVDSGQDIDRYSLALSPKNRVDGTGARFFWLKGGTAFSAVL